VNPIQSARIWRGVATTVAMLNREALRRLSLLQSQKNFEKIFPQIFVCFTFNKHKKGVIWKNK
jgi:hypothetical protein